MYQKIILSQHVRSTINNPSPVNSTTMSCPVFRLLFWGLVLLLAPVARAGCLAVDTTQSKSFSTDHTAATTVGPVPRPASVDLPSLLSSDTTPVLGVVPTLELGHLVSAEKRVVYMTQEEINTPWRWDRRLLHDLIKEIQSFDLDRGESFAFGLGNRWRTFLERAKREGRISRGAILEKVLAIKLESDTITLLSPLMYDPVLAIFEEEAGRQFLFASRKYVDLSARVTPEKYQCLLLSARVQLEAKLDLAALRREVLEIIGVDDEIGYAAHAADSDEIEATPHKLEAHYDIGYAAREIFESVKELVETDTGRTVSDTIYTWVGDEVFRTFEDIRASDMDYWIWQLIKGAQKAVFKGVYSQINMVDLSETDFKECGKVIKVSARSFVNPFEKSRGGRSSCAKAVLDVARCSRPKRLVEVSAMARW